MAASKRRNVHLGDDIWQYTVGKTLICIWAPDGKKTVKKIYEFLDCLRGSYAEYFIEHSHVPITPADIKAYIEKNLS